MKRFIYVRKQLGPREVFASRILVAGFFSNEHTVQLVNDDDGVALFKFNRKADRFVRGCFADCK